METLRPQPPAGAVFSTRIKIFAERPNAEISTRTMPLLSGKELFWKVNMLDPTCRFPAIFEKLSVAMMARSFRL
jgi:hypothetical protein